MTRRTLARAFSAVALMLAAPLNASQQRHTSPPRFSEQIVFLYYSDLAVAEAFFGKALGLEKTMDKDWVKIYRTVSGSSIGAVKEGRGYHKPAASKPVMVSWAVDDVDAWYRQVTAAGIKVLKPPQTSADPPARTLLVEDPTGYTFEFLQWLRP
jgi:predicted enzyme related to lactoylglutathione lyase